MAPPKTIVNYPCKPHIFALTLTVSLSLVACGGGETRSHSSEDRALALAQEVAAVSAPGERKQALAASADTIEATLDWAEWKYAYLFPSGTPSFTLTYLGVDYTLRSYTTANYLAITPSGDVWGLGTFTNDVLMPFGNIADYSAQVRADACLVKPGGCPSPQLLGLNECADPLWASMPAGHRVAATYDAELPEGKGEVSLGFEVVGAVTLPLNPVALSALVTRPC
jgi:hypothetical protein